MTCFNPNLTSDPIIINDAIIILSNIAADGQSGLVHRYSHADGSLVVSFNAFQYALGFTIKTSNKEFIARLKEAIKYNVDVLQPAISDYRNASKALDVAQFNDFAAIKRAFRAHKGLDVYAYLPQGEFEQFKNDYLALLWSDYHCAKARVFQGDSEQHPNKYLQSLGLMQLRLEYVSPSYLSAAGA